MLFRNTDDTKLSSITVNDNVAFEADDRNVAEGWSVIIKGSTHVLVINLAKDVMVDVLCEAQAFEEPNEASAPPPCQPGLRHPLPDN